MSSKNYSFYRLPLWYLHWFSGLDSAINWHNFSVVVDIIKMSYNVSNSMWFNGILDPWFWKSLYKLSNYPKINYVALLYIFRVFRSLPIYSQHLLVLLIGTFRVIHSNSERAKTGMTAEALGVSVAPSFFHTCVSEGSKIAKADEVQKFKVGLITFHY